MRYCLAVLMAMMLVACATVPAIVPDKPKPNQCFDGPFSIFRLQQEKWEVVVTDGNSLFFFKNPNKDARPQIVVAIIHPTIGAIIRFGYLDGPKFRSFMFDPQTECYKEETLDQKIADEMKALILKILKERQV